MIEVDLITGFLGAGKTTFIRKYAEYYMNQGVRVCILENDFGAVNVDMLLLNDLYQKGCGLEMLAGACDKDCHQRRLKTKLIAMRMLGYKRVIIEPSGIYDTEEFFDVLREEPLDEWYRIDNVITLVDSGLSLQKKKGLLSEESEYLLMTQALSAGGFAFSKTDVTKTILQEETVELLNSLLEKYGSQKRLNKEKLVGRPYEEYFDELKQSGYSTETTKKLWFDQRKAYDSLYFMNLNMEEEQLKSILKKLIEGQGFGNIGRIKGFVKTKEDYLQINVTKEQFEIDHTTYGQEVMIVIGENLNKDAISEVVGKQADTL